MARSRSIGIQIRLRVRVEQARLMTIENRIFARRIREAENTMTVHPLYQRWFKHDMAGSRTYSGDLEGAHTMATLSGNMTWYPTLVCRSLLLRKHVCVGCVWIQPQTMSSSPST